MISLEWIFYLMMIFFALIGAIRGWQREVIAISGLTGSIAMLNSFGYRIVLLGNFVVQSVNTSGVNDQIAMEKQSFWIQFVFHIMIAFFSYQVIARLADNKPKGRVGDRLRIGFQQRFIGGCIGLINGYLVIGGLWGFLEYQLTVSGYQRWPAGIEYLFAPTVIRPLVDPNALDLGSYLPFGMFGPGMWLIFFFVSFFIVIIALI